MKELLYILIGLKQYIKQYHWLVKGYDNHILADKLGEGLEDEIDELVELTITASGNENDFIAQELLNRAGQGLNGAYIGLDAKETLKTIADLCVKILNQCKALQGNYKDMTELAFSDYFGRLSNSILRKLYLIQVQIYK